MSKTLKGRTSRHRRQRKQVYGCQREGESSELLSLLSWMCQHGYHDREYPIIPHCFQETGRGMMATEALKAGDIIIEIPQCLLITTQTVMAGYVGAALMRVAKDRKIGFSPREVLSIFLVCEYERGIDSPWWPYLEGLPQRYSTPIYWTQALIKRLPDFVATKVSSIREEIRSSYRTCHEVIHAVLRPAGGISERRWFSRFAWAWSAVNTRCVYWKQPSHSPQCISGEEDHYAMAPFLDLLNHTATAEVDAGYNTSAKCYRIRTLTPYSRDSQVFINYGSHDNLTLLLEYGFILPDNPNNGVRWTLGEVLDTARECGRYTKDLVTELECDSIFVNQFESGLSCSMAGPSWNLQTLIKILTVEKPHRQKWRQYLEGDVTGEHKTRSARLLQALLEQKKKDYSMDAAGCEQSDLAVMVDNLCHQYLDILTHCQTKVT